MPAFESDYPDKKLDMEVTDLVAVNVTENGKLKGVFQLKAFRHAGIMFIGVQGAQFMDDETLAKWNEEHKDELKVIKDMQQSGEGWKDGTPPA